jgi:hypothetical protein
MTLRISSTPGKRWIVFGVTLALSTALLTTSALLGPPASQAAPAPTGSCVDFEGLNPGNSYVVGQAFVDSAVVVFVHPFEFSSGTIFSDGHARVDNQNLAGGSGLDVNANNVNLRFEFAAPLAGLRFRFGEYGGNLNIRINGDFRNVANFIDINGLTIGGVAVSVVNGLGNDAGWVRLSGPIYGFSVGGQELWLDDLCPETDCVDFEDLPLGAVHHVGDLLVDSGVPVSVEPFVWSDGTVFYGGQAVVGNAGLAGGWGLEINTNNVNLAFDFGPDPLKDMFFDFGEYGGNLNIEVNGDFRNVQNFVDIDGLVIGGTQVKVIGGMGGDRGRVFLFGPVEALRVGGQELWLDNVCPGSCCVEFQSLPPAGDYVVSDNFSDTDVHFTLLPFYWSSGTLYWDGRAVVGHQQLAGGTGQDLNLNNVNLAILFGSDVSVVSLLFGEYGGNLNLHVNGDLLNVQNFADIDGTTVAGVSVSVINGLGNDKGRLALTGNIQSLAIGGQELWIDHICFVRSRVFLPLVMRLYES